MQTSQDFSEQDFVLEMLCAYSLSKTAQFLYKQYSALILLSL